MDVLGTYHSKLTRPVTAREVLRTYESITLPAQAAKRLERDQLFQALARVQQRMGDALTETRRRDGAWKPQHRLSSARRAPRPAEIVRAVEGRGGRKPSGGPLNYACMPANGLAPASFGGPLDLPWLRNEFGVSERELRSSTEHATGGLPMAHTRPPVVRPGATWKK